MIARSISKAKMKQGKNTLVFPLLLSVNSAVHQFPNFILITLQCLHISVHGPKATRRQRSKESGWSSP